MANKSMWVGALVCAGCHIVSTSTLVQSAQPATGSGSAVAKYFDTTKPTTISGVVDSIEFGPPTVFIAIAENDKKNIQTVKWVVRGDAPEALERKGWKFGREGMIHPGFEVKVRVYPAKANANALESVGRIPPNMLEAAKAGGLVHGLEFTFSDGKKLYFGPSR
jgi:hypothetical protein